MKRNHRLQNIGLVIAGGLFVASISGCMGGETSNVKQTSTKSEVVASAPAPARSQTKAASISAGSVLVSSSIPYAANAVVNAKVKSECQLDTKLASFIDSYGQSSGVDVALIDKPLTKKSKGKVLLVEITNVQAAGGGVWSGAKSVSVSGKLFENGKLIGDFTGSRYTSGGLFGGFKGTCSLVGRCVKTLGKDIGQWLENPTMGSSLGDG